MKNIYRLLFLLAITPNLFGQIYSEDFENGIPDDWTTEVTEGPGEWITGQSMWLGLELPSIALVFNDDANDMDAEKSVATATSPSIDLSGNSSAFLKFDIGNYILMDNPKVTVEVFSDGDWVEIYDIEGQYPDWESDLILVTETIDVSEYVSDDFKIRFNYDDDETWAFGVAIDNVIIESNLSTNNLSNESMISIYPNPIQDNVNVVLGNIYSKENTKISVYDLSGKIVFNSSYKFDNQYNLSNLANGTYILQVTDGENKISKKIIKK